MMRVSFEEHWFLGSAALRLGGKFYRGAWGVWMEMAGALPGREKTIPAAGGSKYDWENRKIAFRLSAEDLGKLGWALSSRGPGSPLTLRHRYQQRQKTLQLVFNEIGTLFLNAREEPISPSAKEGKRKAVSVPLSADGLWKLNQCIALAYRETICHAASEHEAQTR